MIETQTIAPAHRGAAGTNSVKRYLIRATSGVFGAKMIGTFLGFAKTLALTHFLSKLSFGTYSFVESWALLLVVFAKLGMDDVTGREMPHLRDPEFAGKRHALLRFSNRLIVGNSLLTAVLFALVSWLLLRNTAQTEMMWALVIGSAMIPLLAMVQLRQGILRGYFRAVAGTSIEYLFRPTLFLAMLGPVALYSFAPANATTATLINVLSTGVCVAIGQYVLLRTVPRESEAGEPERRAWMSAGLAFLFIGGMQIINTKTGRILLGTLGSLEDVGSYSVATQMTSVIPFSLMAVNMTIAPLVPVLMGNGERRRMQRILIKSTGLAFAYSVSVFLVFCLFGRPLLRIFGPEFESAHLALCILAGGQVLNVATGPAGTILSAMRCERIVAIGMAASAIGNVILNWLLIPPYGLVGAAIATAVSVAIWNGILTSFAWKRFALNSTLLPIYHRER